MPKEKGVVEAVKPAVNHKQPDGDLVAAKKPDILLRLHVIHETDVEQCAAGVRCIESYHKIMELARSTQTQTNRKKNN